MSLLMPYIHPDKLRRHATPETVARVIEDVLDGDCPQKAWAFRLTEHEELCERGDAVWREV